MVASTSRVQFWQIYERFAYAWSGAGGEAVLQVLGVGSGARDSPLIGFSADALAASNPRRVGRWDGSREWVARKLPSLVSMKSSP
jgi:hypothetical protein